VFALIAEGGKLFHIPTANFFASDNGRKSLAVTEYFASAQDRKIKWTSIKIVAKRKTGLRAVNF